MSQTTTVAVRVTHDVRDRLEAWAREEQMSLSMLLSLLLIRALSAKTKEPNANP